MTMSQSVDENRGNNHNSRVGVVGGRSLEMTPQSQSTAAAVEVSLAEPQQQQHQQPRMNTAQLEEQHRQELEAKINELRAKCRLQAEQLMAWRKAYAIEVSQATTRSRSRRKR